MQNLIMQQRSFIVAFCSWEASPFQTLVLQMTSMILVLMQSLIHGFSMYGASCLISAHCLMV
jgi:hypothetical protein